VLLSLRKVLVLDDPQGPTYKSLSLCVLVLRLQVIVLVLVLEALVLENITGRGPDPHFMMI